MDWVQVARYVAVNVDPAEIAKEGLSDVIPGRAKVTRRKLTMNSLETKTADLDWLPAPTPNDSQKQKLLSLAMEVGIDIIMSNHTFMLGDDIYLQSDGGPIGLEFTGAIARVVMMYWDFLYLEKVAAAGLLLLLYLRYVDDSNQAVKVSDDETIEEVVDKLKEIANSILPGIKMEVDVPSNHEDDKLPILDMKVYMKDNYIVYEHYEKPMASKLVISARSAHSDQTKRSVLISECVRRMLNTSPRLSWQDFVVPHLTEYCRRMMRAGYSEKYRKDILQHAINIYDHKLKMDADGVQPLNRPIGYMKIERRKQKKLKKRSWGTRGGHVAPIIVPATPGGELARRLRKICDAEATAGIKFRIAERGGITIERQLQKSNPTMSDQCGRAECGPCLQPGGNGGKKRCHTNSVVYEYVCQYEGCDAKYTGETSKNLFTRNSEHASIILVETKAQLK